MKYLWIAYFLTSVPKIVNIDSCLLELYQDKVVTLLGTQCTCNYKTL